MMLESWGAILTGWVHETFVDTKYTFYFFGFEWTQILLTDLFFDGDVIYLWFFLMGIIALCVGLGYRYRLTSILLFIFWSTVYFAQKSHYNNHYYLIVLISFLFILLPAAGQYSLDVKSGRSKAISYVPGYQVLVFPVLVAIVYFYATVAKLHPDWLEAKSLLIWLKAKSNYPLIGPILKQPWLAYTLSYGGILFDGLIIFLLLSKRTRVLAILLSLLFHIMNSIIFQIGIFPYLALSFALFFFPSEQVHRYFKSKLGYITGETRSRDRFSLYMVTGFLIIQFFIPLRHHLIKGDVLWTEEGHRCSWRMMLRAKSARTTYRLVTDDGERRIRLRDYLVPHQRADAQWKPDVIWRMAQIIGDEARQKGKKNIQVFVDAALSVNGRTYSQYTDASFNLYGSDWNYCGHQEWLLIAPWAL